MREECVCVWKTFESDQSVWKVARHEQRHRLDDVHGSRGGQSDRKSVLINLVGWQLQAVSSARQC